MNRKSYSIALYLYNHFTDYPDQLNLAGLQADVSFVIFRANTKKRLPTDFYKKYDKLGQVGACVVLKHDQESILQEDINKLCAREQSGDLFIFKSQDR